MDFVKSEHSVVHYVFRKFCSTIHLSFFSPLSHRLPKNGRLFERSPCCMTHFLLFLMRYTLASHMCYAMLLMCLEIHASKKVAGLTCLSKITFNGKIRCFNIIKYHQFYTQNSHNKLTTIDMSVSLCYKKEKC